MIRAGRGLGTPILRSFRSIFHRDGAKKDEDVISGYGEDRRCDQRSGHRIGTAEVESALVSHPSVAEAAVIAFPMTSRGRDLCFVT